jgi:hypothetical protein
MNMRRRHPIVLLAVLVVAIALSAVFAVADAGATSTYTACSPCHGVGAVHPAHAVDVAGDPATCTPCHANGGPAPSQCAACHGAGNILAGHPVESCSTGTPCHAAPSPSPSPSPTDTESPSPTPTATSTPTPSPSATDDGDVAGETEDVGFPTTGYPPSSGGSAPWALIGALCVGGVTLLLAAWRFHTAAGRND